MLVQATVYKQCSTSYRLQASLQLGTIIAAQSAAAVSCTAQKLEQLV